MKTFQMEKLSYLSNLSPYAKKSVIQKCLNALIDFFPCLSLCETAQAQVYCQQHFILRTLDLPSCFQGLKSENPRLCSSPFCLVSSFSLFRSESGSKLLTQILY